VFCHPAYGSGRSDASVRGAGVSLQRAALSGEQGARLGRGFCFLPLLCGILCRAQIPWNRGTGGLAGPPRDGTRWWL